MPPAINLNGGEWSDDLSNYIPSEWLGSKTTDIVKCFIDYALLRKVATIRISETLQNQSNVQKSMWLQKKTFHIL